MPERTTLRGQEISLDEATLSGLSPAERSEIVVERDDGKKFRPFRFVDYVAAEDSTLSF